MKSAIETIEKDGYKMFKNGKDELKTQFGAGMLYALTLLKAEIRDGDQKLDISDEIIEINNIYNECKLFTEKRDEVYSSVMAHFSVFPEKLELLSEHFKRPTRVHSTCNDRLFDIGTDRITIFINGDKNND